MQISARVNLDDWLGMQDAYPTPTSEHPTDPGYSVSSDWTVDATPPAPASIADGNIIRKRQKQNEAARRCRARKATQLAEHKDLIIQLENKVFERDIRLAILEKERVEWQKRELEYIRLMEMLKRFDSLKTDLKAPLPQPQTLDWNIFNFNVPLPSPPATIPSPPTTVPSPESISLPFEVKSEKRPLDSVDSVDTESKKRQKQNEAARRCRQKKLDQLKSYQDTLSNFEKEKFEMSVRLAVLEKEREAWIARERDLQLQVNSLKQKLDGSHMLMMQLGLKKN
ncbi:hypothetical protein HDV01_004577 [Terramyces sp. JEL0728]|nr:hypothetical protein HDV01_004577 [Terramyces sp. JEL0728]